jgi:hypothetical protein
MKIFIKLLILLLIFSCQQKHHYNRAIRISTTTTEDGIAMNAAQKEVHGSVYSIFGALCIDVPQQALAAVVLHRLGRGQNLGFDGINIMEKANFGFELLVPNFWYDNIDTFMGQINNRLLRGIPFEYTKLHNNRVIAGSLK